MNRHSIKGILIFLVLFTSCQTDGYRKPILPFLGKVKFQKEEMDSHDVRSFEVLENGFARDKDRAFFRGEAIQGSDGASFHLLENNYAADKYSVYLGLEGTGSGSYYSRFIYYRLLILEGVDSEELVILKAGYAKDSNHVYKDGELLPESHAPSFIWIEDTGYSMDKDHCYYQSVLMHRADRETFYTAAGTAIAGDKNHIYNYGRIVSQDDPLYSSYIEQLN